MATPDDLHAQALVDTQWLADHLDDPRVRIVEVDLDQAPYDTAHIPGAVFWHGLTTVLGSDLRTRFDPAFVASLLGDSGIADDSIVVAYSDHPALGPWIYWYLRTIGHADVRVLNGGRKKWTAEGRTVTDQVPAVTPVTYRVGAFDSQHRADLDDARAAIGDPDTVLLDVRTADEFDGELFLIAPPEQGERAGHIPGAVHLYYEDAMNDDGTFRSSGELAELLASVGVSATNPVITYCAVGMRSAHMWFVLTVLLGFDAVTSYDGSWNEWGRLADTPIETGGEPAG